MKHRKQLIPEVEHCSIRYFTYLLNISNTEVWEFVDKNISTMPPPYRGKYPHGTYREDQIKKWYETYSS